MCDPLKERILFDKWPVTTNPLWDSLMLTERHHPRQAIDTPLVERPLATLPANNRYRMQILH